MGAFRDKDGKWRYQKRIRLLDGTLTRVKGTPALNTKAHAEQAERAHIERALRGALGPAAKKEVLTLEEFVEIWWEKFSKGGGKKGVNSETTLVEKDMHLRVHLLPRLGHLKLTQITNERMTEFFGLLRDSGYQKKGRRAALSMSRAAVQKRKERMGGRKDRGLPRKGLAEKSVKNIRTTLRTILVFAVKWGYLERLPDLPDVVCPEAGFDWYQRHEAAALIEAARDAWEKALLMFPLHTGARMGEQRAVRWTDVDFERRWVHFRRSSPRASDLIKAPKSNRHRRVDLTPELAAALRSIHHGGELIFCREDGSKLNPGQFHEVQWAAQRRAGLRRIRWHELRHSYASILASGGMPLLMISALLGHSSSKMSERYTHLAEGQSASFMHLLSAAAPVAPSLPAVGGPPAAPVTPDQRN